MADDYAPSTDEVRIKCARCGKVMLAQDDDATAENDGMEVCSICTGELLRDEITELEMRLARSSSSTGNSGKDAGLFVEWLYSIAYPFDLTFEIVPPIDLRNLAAIWHKRERWDCSMEEAEQMIREEMVPTSKEGAK